MNQIVRFGCSLRMPRSWRSDGLWQEVTCLPRLTERLDELELFTAACREGREGPAALCAPTYTHPFLTAGFLANEPWLQTMSLVVVPDAEAAGTVRHELAAFLQNRTVLSLPPRGIWYGSEAEPNPAVVALSLIHISEPTRRTPISYAVFCLKKKKN